MASGRADYWYGMLPGQTTHGLGQSAWFALEYGVILRMVSETWDVYTVPANYKLYLTGGSISCKNPGIQDFLMYFDATEVLNVMYDQYLTLPIAAGGAYILDAGATLKVKLYNRDVDVQGLYYVSLSGFEEYLIV